MGKMIGAVRKRRLLVSAVVLVGIIAISLGIVLAPVASTLPTITITSEGNSGISIEVTINE